MNTSNIHNTPIDILYLWCDMNDEHWNERRKEEVEKWSDKMKFADADIVSRYQSHDELRYSLRSVAMYAPWIRNIFIVVCDYATLPSWLNTSHPRLRIVRHSEIIPSQYLPCYNSVTIEHYISRIPELSEYFLYANDDMFFFDYVTPDFFFEDNGLPKKRVIAERNHPEDGYYFLTIENSLQLVETHHPELNAADIDLLSLLPHHGIDAYRKSHNIATYERYHESIEASIKCPFRCKSDIQRVIYLMEEVATYGATNVIINNLTPYSICSTGKRWRKQFENVLRLRPKLLCLNATHDNDADDFQWLTLVQQMLYPEKSEYEI